MKKVIFLITFILLFPYAPKAYAVITLCMPLTAFSPPPLLCTSYVYNSWSECSEDGIRTRSISESLPTGCTCGGPERITLEPCAPHCSGSVLSGWGTCIDGQQTRTITSYTPSGCEGEPAGSPTLVQSCTSCTGRIYSNWGDCIDGQQERIVLSKTPSGCVGGPTSEAILQQTCPAEENPVPDPEPTPSPEPQEDLQIVVPKVPNKIIETPANVIAPDDKEISIEEQPSDVVGRNLEQEQEIVMEKKQNFIVKFFQNIFSKIGSWFIKK
jgi:hypothetical protein